MSEATEYFGLLRDAPVEFLDLLETDVLDVLQQQGWDADATLFYMQTRESFDVDLAVMATLHAWDDDSPLAWIVTTVGLSALEQAFDEDPEVAGAFPRFELATVSNTMSPNGPIPQSLAVALAGEELPGWAWDEVDVPPMVDWLFFTAQNLASMIVHDDAVFRLGQYVIGTGNPAPASRLLDLLLMPACPHMLAAGLEPMAGDEPVEVEDWWTSPGLHNCDLGFVWALPIDEQERRIVETGGVEELFTQLVARAEADGREDQLHVAFDVLRLPAT